MRPPGPSFHVCLPWKLSTAVVTCSPDVTLISTTSEPKDTVILSSKKHANASEKTCVTALVTGPTHYPPLFLVLIHQLIGLRELCSCSKKTQLLHIIKSYLFFSSSTKFLGAQLTVSGFCGWSPSRPIQKPKSRKTTKRQIQESQKKNWLQPHKVKEGNKQNTASPDPQPPSPTCFCFNEPTIGNHLNQPQSSRQHLPTPTARRVDHGKIQLFDGIYRGKKGGT